MEPAHVRRMMRGLAPLAGYESAGELTTVNALTPAEALHAEARSGLLAAG